MTREACVEHHYPAALAFLHKHGPDALAVLHDLLQRAELVDGVLTVRCSTRDVAARLGFLSKDSVHRRLRALLRAGVLVVDEPVIHQFGLRCYRVHLEGTGITLITEPGEWR